MKETNRQNAVSDRLGQRTAVCPEGMEWEPLLYDLAEGLCDAQTAADTEAHLAACPACRASYAEIRRTVSVLRASAPTPMPGLQARIMERIEEEDEDNGRVVCETVDMRTGRVVAVPHTQRIRRLVRMLGGIAAVLVLAIGLYCLIPFLPRSSGATSGVQDIIGSLQVGSDNHFSDGVFVGTPKETAAADSMLVVPEHNAPSVTETAIQQYAVVFDVYGADAAEVLSLLAPLADDDPSVRVTAYADGILVSPLSVWRTAASLLDAENLTVVIEEGQTASDGNDAFYIMIREP
ncbi:MAG: zf-HC2 domain-containing protein [Clostridia bacterium]|nr:zf-HC2 domain-containing protein [Clostridia bacterium]